MSLQPPSRPVTLPPELWESVFLHLAPGVILKFREVNRGFRDLIDGSPEVQFLIDLYAAGLEVGYQDPSLTIGDRREQLDRYRLHWDSLQWVKHTSHPLPFYKYQVHEGGVVCFVLHAGLEDTTTDYRFIQLPSVLRGIPLKDWTVHGLPHHFQKPGFLPEEDLLVVCSPVDRGRSFTIQLLRMSDGQPHPSASAPVINGPDYGKEWVAGEMQVQLTRSRLAVTVMTLIDLPPRVPRLIVWDWKTGVKYVDVLRLSQTVQFVDECRMFGVSKAMDPGSWWSFTLLDTSAPVEDPQKPREIEFELDYTQVLCHSQLLDSAHLARGTYTQGGRQASPFRTDRKNHVLGITRIYTSGYSPPFSPEFVIDYGSICTIASENKTASSIPWDLWKHKATLLDRYVESATAIESVGPRVLAVSKKPYQGPSLRLFDFTPGACRFTKQIDTSFDDDPRYVIRRAKLMDTFPEGRMVKWVLSEDNVLAFTRLSSDHPEVLEMWTF